MPRTDPLEAEIMKDCQLGAVSCRDPEHRATGSFCRKPLMCRDEGRCYFVARMERAMVLGLPKGGFVVDQSARIEACRSCGQAIWWGKTANKKTNPYDVVGTLRTGVSHFSTCPDAKHWSRKKQPAPEPEPIIQIRWHQGVDGFAWAL